MSPDTGAESPYDLVAVGRVGVDIYPQQVGLGLEDVESFAKFLGGSPTNVAVAAARLGRRTAVVTRVGDDPFGRFVHRALRGFGVDDRFVSAVADLPTPVTFCELFPPDDFPLWFYGRSPAPDLMIHADEMSTGATAEAVRDARILWVTGTGLSREPSRSATMAALETRGRRGITIFDLDYRPMFWADRQQATEAYAAALPLVSVAVGNLDECETAVGEREPDAAVKALRTAGVDLAVVKQGPAGVRADNGNGPVVVPPTPVEVVNGLGAGDAFGGALCHGLLGDWPLERVLRFANAAGALVASRLACAEAMPTTDEVEALT